MGAPLSQRQATSESSAGDSQAAPGVGAILERGPVPPAGSKPRWLKRIGLPAHPLPPLTVYECARMDPVSVGAPTERHPWRWSESFGKMVDGGPTAFESRAALGWDDDFLYAAFDFVDFDREARVTEDGTHMYSFDTTAELFVGGPRGYYELGLNSAGARYEMSWVWVEPLVESRSYADIEELFKLPNYLYYLAQDGAKAGRVGDLDFRLDGYRHGVRPRVQGDGWTAQIALPWSSLAPLLGISTAPKAGTELRVQAYRAHHATPPPPEGASPEPWAWAVQGNDNVHNPQAWARVQLSGR